MTLIINKKVEKKYDYNAQAKHQSWCLRNDIVIQYNPIDNYKGFISIIENGKFTRLPEIYKSRKADRKAKDKDWSKEIIKLNTIKYLENNE